MNVGIINLSKDPAITHAALEEIADALQEQSFGDVAPFRQTGGVPCKFYPNATALITLAGTVKVEGLPPGTAPHLVLDTPEDQGELGDHFFADDLPILRSFWGPVRDSGGSLFADFAPTMSHEHIEASEDPYATGWFDWPDGVHEEADEACDRPEGSSYKRPGSRVYVSNFLSARAKRPGPGPYDYMGLFSVWNECPEDGYRILRVGGPQGVTKAVFGPKVPKWKIALKMLPHAKATRRGVIWDVQTDVENLARASTEPPRE